MIDIELAIEKYGACKHGILPLLRQHMDLKIEPCLLCKKERSHKYINSSKGSSTASVSNHNRRAAFLKKPGQHSSQDWLVRFLYWNERCVLCNIKLTLVPNEINTVTKDHMIPMTWTGGSNEAWNLAPLCLSCNTSKNNRFALYEYPEGSKILIAVYK